jgi:hypothetical protein
MIFYPGAPILCPNTECCPGMTKTWPESKAKGCHPNDTRSSLDDHDLSARSLWPIALRREFEFCRGTPEERSASGGDRVHRPLIRRAYSDDWKAQIGEAVDRASRPRSGNPHSVTSSEIVLSLASTFAFFSGLRLVWDAGKKGQKCQKSMAYLRARHDDDPYDLEDKGKRPACRAW